MLADHHRLAIHPRTRLLIAGATGLLIAVLATFQIFLPSLALLAQFPQFSPLARASLLVKFLSPLLSFLLAAGWVWTLLWLAEMALASRGSKERSGEMPPFQQSPLQERREHRREEGEKATGMQEDTTDSMFWEPIERERLLATPPLFQLDPATPWQSSRLPITPPPMTNPAWSPDSPDASGASDASDTSNIEEEESTAEREMQAEEGTQGENEQEKSAQGKESEEEKPSMTQVEQVNRLEVIAVPTQPQQTQERPERAEEARGMFSVHAPAEQAEMRKPVTMTLLKHMRAWVQADDGTTLEIKLRGGESAIRLIQLAYIAWRQGAPVDRDKVLTYVLSRGKRREMNVGQLGEVFDGAKRYLRQDLDRAVNELKKQGHPLSEEVDFFRSEQGFYRLHSSCRVADLEEVEAHHHTIQMARKEGLLNGKPDGSVPDRVVEACRKLLQAYVGDFLHSLVTKFPDEFGSWVREPVTLYRDYYLDALLILANHESARGRHFLDETLSAEQNEEQRRYHSGRAAQLFYDYAMYALNNRWDQKLKFAYRANKDGERVIRAERAIRRCVVELGKLGNPDMIDQAYLTFKERMATLSEGTWKPDRDTESDVAEAKRTTNAYRFSSQIPASQDKSNGES